MNSVGPNRIRLARFQSLLTYFRKSHRHRSTRRTRLPMNSCACHRLPSCSINDPERGGVSNLRRGWSGKLQEMGLAKGVECEEDLVRGSYFLLASSDRGELEVVEDAPELGGGLAFPSDGGDEEVVKF
jgi:hypothetical protein